METLDCVLEDPLIKTYLKRFQHQEWPDVIKKTLKLGIHSMKTVESLSLNNQSPEKNISIIDMDPDPECDATIIFADSLNNKIEATTNSSKEGTKLIRNESKLPGKKKKALSLVKKNKGSRATPKGKRSGFEMLKEKKDTKRIHSVKNKGKLVSIGKETQKIQDVYLSESRKHLEYDMTSKKSTVKSFKSLKNKGIEIQIPNSHLKESPKNVKNSLGMQELSEFYKNSMSCRNQPVNFPLKVNNKEADPFMYVTSSSDESTP
jgi:hypothetical protein